MSPRSKNLKRQGSLYDVDREIEALPSDIRDHVRTYRRAAAGQLQRRAIWACRADCIRAVLPQGETAKRQALLEVSKLLRTADTEARKAGNGCGGGEDAMWSYWEVNGGLTLEKMVRILRQAWR